MNTYELFEQLDDMGRFLVEIQIKIASIQKNMEKEMLKDTKEAFSRLVNCSIEYFQGPPQELKIISSLYPPKIKAHPEPLHRKYKSGPLAYSQVRNLWFATIRDAFIDKRDKIAELKVIQKAIVWYTFFYNDKRLHDPDNYTIKFINDVLVKCKIMVDDDYHCMKYVVEGCYDEKPRTEIVVTEDVGQLEKIRPELLKINVKPV